jgi:hypothetical protein
MVLGLYSLAAYVPLVRQALAGPSFSETEQKAAS